MLPFLCITIGIVLLITLFLLSKIKLVISYDDELKVYAKYLFFKKQFVPPEKRKLKKKKKKESEDAEKKPSEEKKLEKKSEKSTLTKLFEVREAILRIIKVFLNKLHFKFIRLRIIVACDDASKTALAYAGATQGVSYIIEILRNISNVEVSSQADILVEPNFISQKSEFECKIQLYIRVLPAIIVITHAFTEYFKHKAKTEG